MDRQARHRRAPRLRYTLGRDEEAVARDAIAARQEAEATEEEASPSRWREADNYATLAERGWSTRRIAEKCETNKDTVSYFVRCARLPRETRGSCDSADSAQSVNRNANGEMRGKPNTLSGLGVSAGKTLVRQMTHQNNKICLCELLVATRFLFGDAEIRKLSLTL